MHNRKAGETWLFDVGLSGELGFCEPVGQSTRIPFNNNNSNDQNGEYPTHWVVFSPDIVIDANSGTMWRLKLKLNVVNPEEEEGCGKARNNEFSRPQFDNDEKDSHKQCKKYF